MDSIMEPLDLNRLSALHRMLLGSIMKTKLFSYRGVIAHVVVRGAQRRRGRSGFTEEQVTAALDQLIEANMIEKFRRAYPADDEASNPTWVYHKHRQEGELMMLVDHIKLTIEGWTVAAQLNLDRVYR